MANSVSDPALQLLLDYRRISAAAERNEPDLAERRQRFEIYARLRNELPPIATEEGAIEAIRTALGEDTFLDPLVERLLRAALAYFDGRA